MPINYKNYPPDWKSIRQRILKRAGNKCELCPAENGKPHWKTKSKVVLTIHHIRGKHSTDLNLIALCQRCHLRLDLEKHIRNREARRGGYQETLAI
jgi:5-methylcytosine-specific restriction endonuclease McrA